MVTTIVTTKGQVVIPSRIRRKLNINKGMRLSVEERDNEIILIPLTPAYFGGLTGILSTKGRLANMMIEARTQDRAKGEK